MANKLHVFIPIGKFDRSKLSILDAKIKKSKKGNETCESLFAYDIGNGKRATDIYIQLPKKETFGVFPSYPFGLEKQFQNADTINGYQTTYPLSSQETMNNLTNNEQYVKDLLDYLFGLTWDKLVEECDKEGDDRIIPAVTYGSYLGSKDKKGNVNKQHSIKPLYEYPNKKQEGGDKKKREKDFDKPQRMYLKLDTFGEGKNLKCYTKIYGPGNKIIHPLKYSGVKTDMEIVIQLNKVFWGAHGRNSHGGSINIRISEMNVVPVGQESHRFLSPNAAPEEDENELEGQDSSFINPLQEDTSDFLKDDEEEKKIEIIDTDEEEEETKPKKKVEEKKKKKKSNK